jgi:hypothetical protein
MRRQVRAYYTWSPLFLTILSLALATSIKLCNQKATVAHTHIGLKCHSVTFGKRNFAKQQEPGRLVVPEAVNANTLCRVSCHHHTSITICGLCRIWPQSLPGSVASLTLTTCQIVIGAMTAGTLTHARLQRRRSLQAAWCCLRWKSLWNERDAVRIEVDEIRPELDHMIRLPQLL